MKPEMEQTRDGRWRVGVGRMWFDRGLSENQAGILQARLLELPVDWRRFLRRPDIDFGTRSRVFEIVQDVRRETSIGVGPRSFDVI